VQSEHPLDRWADHRAIEASVLDHALASGATFLGRLEQERDGMRQLLIIRDGLEHPGGSEKYGRMTVMSAGMHPSIDCGGVRDTALLMYGQGVDVGPKSDCLLGISLKMGKYARATCQIALEFDSGAFEFLAYATTRPVLLVHDLGMSVKIMPELDEFGKNGIDMVPDGC
jgi:hypothetical protein